MTSRAAMVKLNPTNRQERTTCEELTKFGLIFNFYKAKATVPHIDE